MNRKQNNFYKRINVLYKYIKYEKVLKENRDISMKET